MNRASLNFFASIFTIATCMFPNLLKAEILLADDFDYAAGALTTRPGSPWSAHSNPNQNRIQVTAEGGIRLVGAGSSEDASASLADWPKLTNTPQTLYAAFKLRYANNGATPRLGGGYFAHFIDPGFIYPCRVWATTNGVEFGSYRVGISTGQTNDSWLAGQFPMDLSTGITYQVVVRFDTAQSLSTIWVNPAAEADLSVTATNQNFLPDYATKISHFAFRQANNSGTCLIDELRVGTQFIEVLATNRPAFISPIDDQTIAPNTSTGPIGFLVNDIETAADDLVVAAVSLNETLVSPAGITLGGTGTNRTITVTPLVGQQGVARIKLLVTDGSGTVTVATFDTIVGVPEISCLVNQIIATNTGTGPLSFLVNHATIPATSLTLEAESSNTNLIAPANIVFGGSGRVRTISINPNPDQAGIATVTVKVFAGNVSASSQFTVTVQPLLGELLNEDISYADGTALTDGSTPWNNSAGTVGQTKVLAGKIILSQTNNESLYRSLAVAPGQLNPTNGAVLFASMKINFMQRPTATANRPGFLYLGGVLYGIIQGAPAGHYWLAVSESSTVEH